MSGHEGELDQTADAGTKNAPLALAPGSHLGKYRLDRVLGEGGMGVVWAAHDPDLERSVAIKVLRYAQASQQLRQRLLREARAMAKLKHPNVLTVYEVGTVGDRDYIAMELVDGMSLDQWLSSVQPTYGERWSAILAAGRGLAAAHDAGVVHRDFKPHNVLRSREGRVLVTDFGLARGMLAADESAALDAAVPPLDGSITPFDETLQAARKSDSVLDSPLTQTGALIGTPAYMAPEQYAGSPPDPRTDQFAFCVTAWQALTGERPFKGATLDELRQSASAGVAHIPAKLAGAVRAVLTRGLDPRAARRWPSMETLLDELERADKLPGRRRRLVISSTTAAVAAAITAVVVARGPHARAKDSCDEPAAQFEEAWSSPIKGELARKVPATTFAHVAEAFDQYKQRWVVSYESACQARTAKTFPARVGCLEGVRDNVAALTMMLRDADPHVFDVIDIHGMLPNLASCEVATPYAPPPVPKEQPRRGKILGALARTIALRGVPDAKLRDAIDSIVAEASVLAWPPLVQGALVAGGNEYLRRHDEAAARELFRRAKSLEKPDLSAYDRRLEAMTRIGLLEASLHRLENPGRGVPIGMTDPAAKPVLHPELADELVAARMATEDDPMLSGANALVTANAYTYLGQYNRYRHAYSDALQYAAHARKLFESIGDTQRLAHALSIEAWIYLERGDDRALDDAVFAARRASDALELAQLPPLPELDLVRAEVAFMRRDFTEVHRLLDAHAQSREIAGVPLVKGHVTGGDPSTIVVAWHGELRGDPRRIFIDARDLPGDVATVDADGSFTIHAAPDWAIMAEGKGGRSTPKLVGASPALVLAPTTTVSGTVQGKNLLGVRAYARFTVGTARWFMEVPVERDGVFDLRGLPPGAAVFGTRGTAGSADRVVVATSLKDVAWPYGQSIEIVARGAHAAGATAWLVRGRHSAATPGELATLTASADDVASGPLVPVGADNTDAGREVYRAGDLHAVITGNADDDYTACVATTSSVVCKAVAVTRTVTVEYPDGRFAAGTTPIVFEL